MLSILLAVAFYFLGMFEGNTANRALNQLYGDPLEENPVVKAVVLIGWPLIALYLILRLLYLNVTEAFKPTEADKRNEAAVDADIQRMKDKIKFWENYKNTKNDAKSSNNN